MDCDLQAFSNRVGTVLIEVILEHFDAHTLSSTFFVPQSMLHDFWDYVKFASINSERERSNCGWGGLGGVGGQIEVNSLYFDEDVLKYNMLISRCIHLLKIYKSYNWLRL